MINIAEAQIMSLKEVQEYLVGQHKILTNSRVEKLYEMITNVDIRVDDADEKWVAFCTQGHEKVTVEDAIKKIIVENTGFTEVSTDIISELVDEAGYWFVKRRINLKPNQRENNMRKNQREKAKPRLERTIPPMVNRIINRSRAENLLISDPRRLSSVKIM